MNIAFALLAALGILTALFGIAIDFLPGSSPGLNLPQMLLIAAGLFCFLTGLVLRSAHIRRRVSQNARKHWLPGVVIAAATLIALELALTAADAPTYFPPPIDDVPQPFYQSAPWWTCDEAGCHYVQAHIAAACASRQLVYDRECIINPQGFHDAQDFTAADDLNNRARILTLGDSFTFGLSSAIGESYVETIESNFPQTIVWNTAIPGAGTHQALAAFQMYAPLLQPQLAILGFVLNDFRDNLLPIDYRLMGIDWNSQPFRIWRYHIESSGKVSELDYRHLYYSRHNRVSPPDSEIERLIGQTRIGSLLPRFLYKANWDADRGRYVRIPAAVDATRGYLRALRDAAAAQNTALLILLIPDRGDIHDPALRYQTARQLIQELAIPWLDPIHALDAALDYTPPDDGHWNTAGHQKIGAILSDCIAIFHISQNLADCQQVSMP